MSHQKIINKIPLICKHNFKSDLTWQKCHHKKSCILAAHSNRTTGGHEENKWTHGTATGRHKHKHVIYTLG